MLNGLDLFSGIGGLSLALSEWVEPIAYCELDPYCQSVLLSQMQRGNLKYAPIWDDVRTLCREHIDVPVDIIYGGFPCQDISVAGNGKGLAGERSGLFFEIARLVDEIRPSFVFLENVPAITSRGLGEVAAAFTRLRYDCRWGVVSAYDVGAPHLRKRWFLLAHRNGDRREVFAKPHDREGSQGGRCDMGRFSKASEVGTLKTPQQGCSMGDAAGKRRSKGRPESEVRGRSELASCTGGEWDDWWTVEPDVGRVAHGVPFRVDRIRGLGNAVVPLQAREAFKKLIGLGD